MITFHYYLDTRAVNPGQAAPLKMGIGKRQRTAYLPTGISLLPSEWDAKGQRVIVNPRRKVLNSDLARMKAQAEDYLRPMLYNGELADLTVTQIRDLVKGHFYGHFTALKLRAVYFPVMSSKGAGTAVFYREAWRRLQKWRADCDTLPISSITPSWVSSFADWLGERYKPNTVVSTLRCFRAVWNEAVRNGRVSGNPFEGISLSPAQTHGRDLTLAQIRAFWRATPETEREAEALDFFRLSFLLRAINPTDLLRVGPADVTNGRLYYNRQKTGKAISVKIEPEAAEIIERRGDKKHLFAISCTSSAFGVRSRELLKKIATRNNLPPITPYYARHTLASLLFEQGGSMDVVSAILSHSLGGARVTATYVAVREARLDEAMRSVIDAVIAD